MARFRRPVIFSLKHVVDSSASIAAGTQLNTVVMDAVQTPVLTTPAQTAIGARVSAFYLRVEVAVDIRIAGVIPNFYMIVYKNVGSNINPPSPASVGTSDVKRFVLHQEMVMLDNSSDAPNPRTVFNGVIRIPRGMARQGNDDLIQISTLCPSLTTKQCIQVIYKEFR